MMVSTPFFQKQVQESMSQELSFWIWNQQLLMKSKQEHTDNYFTQDNWFQERKMLPTSTPEVITVLVRNMQICTKTESESWLITAQISKVSWLSTQLEEEQDQDWVHIYWKDYQSIIVKNLNWLSPFIHPQNFQQPSLNHITPSCQPAHCWNTQMSVSFLIMKLFMILAKETWILKDQNTLTWTDWLLKLFPHWQLQWDLMVPWMSISLVSKLTWCHIQESTLCFAHMPQSSRMKRLIMNIFQLLKSQIQPSNQPTWWLHVTQDMVNTWPALCFIEVM